MKKGIGFYDEVLIRRPLIYYNYRLGSIEDRNERLPTMHAKLITGLFHDKQISPSTI
jgi:hypothetical protein